MAGILLNRSRQVPAEETPAFGGIAERFRRAGDLDRAIALCRDGLKRFPEQLSARVTLGWALLDKGQYEEARAELERVLRKAPDNLAAIRGLAELHDRSEGAMMALEESDATDAAIAAATAPPTPVATAPSPKPAARSATAAKSAKAPAPEAQGVQAAEAADPFAPIAVSLPVESSSTPELLHTAEHAGRAAEEAAATSDAFGTSLDQLVPVELENPAAATMAAAEPPVAGPAIELDVTSSLSETLSARVAALPEQAASALQDVVDLELGEDDLAGLDVEATLDHPAPAIDLAAPLEAGMAADAELVVAGESASPDLLADLSASFADSFDAEQLADAIRGLETDQAGDIDLSVGPVALEAHAEATADVAPVEAETAAAVGLEWNGDEPAPAVEPLAAHGPEPVALIEAEVPLEAVASEALSQVEPPAEVSGVDRGPSELGLPGRISNADFEPDELAALASAPVPDAVFEPITRAVDDETEPHAMAASDTAMASSADVGEQADGSVVSVDVESPAEVTLASVDVEGQTDVAVAAVDIEDHAEVAGPSVDAEVRPAVAAVDVTEPADVAADAVSVDPAVEVVPQPDVEAAFDQAATVEPVAAFAEEPVAVAAVAAVAPGEVEPALALVEAAPAEEPAAHLLQPEREPEVVGPVFELVAPEWSDLLSDEDEVLAEQLPARDQSTADLLALITSDPEPERAVVETVPAWVPEADTAAWLTPDAAAGAELVDLIGVVADGGEAVPGGAEVVAIAGRKAIARKATLGRLERLLRQVESRRVQLQTETVA